MRPHLRQNRAAAALSAASFRCNSHMSSAIRFLISAKCREFFLQNSNTVIDGRLRNIVKDKSGEGAAPAARHLEDVFGCGRMPGQPQPRSPDRHPELARRLFGHVNHVRRAQPERDARAKIIGYIIRNPGRRSGFHGAPPSLLWDRVFNGAVHTEICRISCRVSLDLAAGVVCAVLLLLHGALHGEDLLHSGV